MHMNHMGKTLFKKKLEWMSNQWSNLTIQEKFFKTIEFHAFWGKQKSWTFGVIIKNGTHHLIQMLLSKCWKHWATKCFSNFHILVLHIAYSFLSWWVAHKKSYNMQPWKTKKLASKGQVSLNDMPTTIHVCQILKPMFPTRNIERREDQILDV